MTSPAQLDREIAESYLGMIVTADTSSIPPRRVTGVARGITATARGTVMLTLEKPDGSIHNVFVGSVVPQVPQTYRGRSHATMKKVSLGRYVITEEQARTMPRFEFIAHWLAIVTRKKKDRGPLGLYVRRVGKRWQVVSPVGGGTVTYETTDPALLFDYVRRGQLGSNVRDAEEFRVLAYQRAGVE